MYSRFLLHYNIDDKWSPQTLYFYGDLSKTSVASDDRLKYIPGKRTAAIFLGLYDDDLKVVSTECTSDITTCKWMYCRLNDKCLHTYVTDGTVDNGFFVPTKEMEELKERKLRAAENREAAVARIKSKPQSFVRREEHKPTYNKIVRKYGKERADNIFDSYAVYNNKEAQEKALDEWLGTENPVPVKRVMISALKREKIYQLHGRKCLKCGVKDNLTIDHVIPLCKGGSNKDFNLQLLCFQCNNEKGNDIVDYRNNIPRHAEDKGLMLSKDFKPETFANHKYTSQVKYL